MRIASIIVLAVFLGGCPGRETVPASIAGECQIFTDPGYAVKGKTKRDQFWIDSQLESGYASCDWKRPGKAK